MEINFIRKLFQHADHFTRILSEQEIFRKSKTIENGLNTSDKTISKETDKVIEIKENKDQ